MAIDAPAQGRPAVTRLEVAEGRWLVGDGVEVDLHAIAAGPLGLRVAEGVRLPEPVYVAEGWDVRRVAVVRASDGGLTVDVSPAGPHAEVGSVRVDRAAGVVLVGGTLPPGETGLEGAPVVARLRGRGTERAFAAEVARQRWGAHVPLASLGDERGVWELSLGDLPLATHQDGIAAKAGVVVFPAVDGAQPAYDAANRLVIRTGQPPQAAAAGADAPLEPGAAMTRRRRLLGGAAVAVHRAALATAGALLRRRRITTSDSSQAGSEPELSLVAPGAPVRILLVHAYGMGGTIRTSFNLAEGLAEERHVELISLVRRRDAPFFDVPDGVEVTALHDVRPGRARPGALGRVLERLPSLLIHPDDHAYGHASLRSDLALVRSLRAMPPGVLVTTRPAFNLAAARLAPAGVRVIAQEHMNIGSHHRRLLADVRRGYRRLDALAVLTEDDRADYADLLRGAATRLVRIPNALPPLDGGTADPAARVVVAAGRLNAQKGFDLLIRAWERVSAERPGWQLRIFGSGALRPALRAMILERELYGSAFLMGPTRHVGDAYASGSVYALSSRFEGFGMVIVEAMSKGLAVASFDCPRGPSEIIHHGRDGLLVPDGDVGALTDALLELTGDEDLRRRLGSAALQTARRYDAAAIAARWREVLAELEG